MTFFLKLVFVYFSVYLNGDENMESNFQKIQDTVTLLLETQKKSFHLPGINS